MACFSDFAHFPFGGHQQRDLQDGVDEVRPGLGEPQTCVGGVGAGVQQGRQGPGQPLREVCESKLPHTVRGT